MANKNIDNNNDDDDDDDDDYSDEWCAEELIILPKAADTTKPPTKSHDISVTAAIGRDDTDDDWAVKLSPDNHPQVKTECKENQATEDEGHPMIIVDMTKFDKNIHNRFDRNLVNDVEAASLLRKRIEAEYDKYARDGALIAEAIVIPCGSSVWRGALTRLRDERPGHYFVPIFPPKMEVSTSRIDRLLFPIFPPARGTRSSTGKQTHRAAPSNDKTQYDQDEMLARDMQLAFELQAREEQRAIRRDMKKAAKSDDDFDVSKLNADHMLFVSCTLDGSEVKMLVDTGASSSAMSLDMVRSLGLESKLNRGVYGSARGVGSSNIVGILENVELMIHHVEFLLYFMVIDSNLPCCILGLDQMRKYKCQVYLDEEVLVFGGKGGVSVPFLPQPEAMAVTQQMIAASNIVPNAAASIGTPTRQQQEAETIEGKIKSLFGI